MAEDSSPSSAPHPKESVIDSQPEPAEESSKTTNSTEVKEHDTSSTPLTQELQESIVIDDANLQIADPPKDSVTDFISGLTPFISALEDLDGIGPSPTAKPSAEIKDENIESAAVGTTESTKIEERVMRPIRELIYKSFHEPSEGEEGIEYVISQLSTLKMLSEGCSTDLVVRSIGHFLSMSLPPSWIDSMCRWMLDRMQLILLKFFTFKHYCSCYFNCDVASSRLFVLQSALHRRFPLLISEGCASLSRPPVFYGTKQCSLFVDNNHIACSWQLLQTGASFKTISLSQHSSKRRAKQKAVEEAKGGPSEQEVSPLTLCCRTLEQEIERDQSKGRLPCVVIAAPTDNLQKIRSICDRHGLWLHIEGGSSSLLLAAATTLPKSTRIMMQCADSISCRPFEWFTASSGGAKAAKVGPARKPKISVKGGKGGAVRVSHAAAARKFGADVPGNTATLTFVREDLRDTPPPAMGYSDAAFVVMFPLWHLLVTRSIHQIKNRVDHSLSLCRELSAQLVDRKNIFDTLLLAASLPQAVVFQISPNLNVVDLSAFKLDVHSFHELLVSRCGDELSKLHIEWKLYDDDDADCLSDDVHDDRFSQNYYASDEEAMAPGGGDPATMTPYFRFEPLMSNQPEAIRSAFISELIQKIVVEINILRKCLELRRLFQECIAEDAQLDFVDPAAVQTVMIGLGAFRFVPLFFRNAVDSESVHILNKTLCDDLNAESSGTVTQCFKLSMDLSGVVCIVINPTNLVFEDDCVHSLFRRIDRCHRKMRYPQEVMEVMSRAVQSGIERAEDVRQLRASGDYTVDKIVRSVPIVGGIYGWLLPDGAEDGDLVDPEMTGVGFQLGVGVTSPQIQIQPATPSHDDAVAANDQLNENESNAPPPL